MSISQSSATNTWWQKRRPWLIALYIVVALALVIISGTGHKRLLDEVGKTFGGFFWAIDTDNQVVIVSTPTQLPPFEVKAASFVTNPHIIAVNNVKGIAGMSRAFDHARAGNPIIYSVATTANRVITVTRPAVTFTWDMWWQNYGLGFLGGLCWLAVGFFLLATATEWTGAVEGIILLPPAMLLLLYSHYGNIQTAYQADLVFQLLWVPSFALLGAAFIHLSLAYRPETLSKVRTPLMMDYLPYLPLVALVAYEWSSVLISGFVPTRVNLTLSLGYAVIGGLISIAIGLSSLGRIGIFLPWRRSARKFSTRQVFPPHIRQRIGDLLALWIGGMGVGFFFGVLPIALSGQTLLPLAMFYILVAAYPFILLYAIRSLRLIDRLHVILDLREDALREQRKTAEELMQTNRELKQATSLLLHADAHLRSLLSQRIHDQPKQQALRIRSLLGHWQHKLRVEAERDPGGKVIVQPIVEALEKVRKISEELEGDLRGLQLLVEDAYQRQSLGLKLHLEKLIREDLPMLHPESPLKVQADLWALDALSPDLEQTEDGAKIAEAISYTVTQALLNIYNHAGATFATVRTVRTNGFIEVYITDDGRGFDLNAIPPEKTSLFKAQLKVREANGSIVIQSIPRPQARHGTTIMLRLPLPRSNGPITPEPMIKPHTQKVSEAENKGTYFS